MSIQDHILAFDRQLIKHCAPVLAGIKPGGMYTSTFRCPKCRGKTTCTSLAPVQMLMALEDCSCRLRERGVQIHVLAQRERGLLLFVYREQLLKQVLAQQDTNDYLESLGYSSEDLSSCLATLTQRIEHHDLLASSGTPREFPHEVGIICGYPLQDVLGFTRNAGEGCVCSGCWKVYSDEQRARELFSSYEACTRRCLVLHESGTPLEELADLGTAEHRRYAA